MIASLPQLFLERLERIIPPEKLASVFSSFEKPKVSAFRVNTLKNKPEDIFSQLENAAVSFEKIAWLPGAFVLKDSIQADQQKLLDGFVAQGFIYKKRVV